jgi:hypothetical protein
VLQADKAITTAAMGATLKKVRHAPACLVMIFVSIFISNNLLASKEKWRQIILT